MARTKNKETAGCTIIFLHAVLSKNTIKEITFVCVLFFVYARGITPKQQWRGPSPRFSAWEKTSRRRRAVCPLFVPQISRTDSVCSMSEITSRYAVCFLKRNCLVLN